ncbi:SMP-30/gluconolactonase/LRE family protein [Planctomicrobium sp. SH664]|uniref:SMP-30/gluconolactonase/LRE family protein n=1 Tax=Planctomicrobium sp. SH664 TaxID=3448125 RepID=UPI003F5C6615
MSCALLFTSVTHISLLPAQDTKNLPTIGRIRVDDPQLETLIDPAARIEVLAGGFTWTEGPCWVPQKEGPGYLLFSDIPNNAVMKWVEGEGARLYMKPSGYTGVVDYPPEPGSNGLLLDKEGRLLLCEHGDRRIAYLTADGGKRTLADNYKGKRFNSPNDGVLKSNGDLYFTDPCWGLPQKEKDPRRELEFTGLFRVTPAGEVTLLAEDIARPNGIEFSPDEKTLYVTYSASDSSGWLAYDVNADGTLSNRRIFFDGTALTKKGRIGGFDGMCADKQGNLFVTAPGGIYIFTPEGKLLGNIFTGERISNCTFGGPNRDILYFTSDTYVCRVPTKTTSRKTTPHD